MAECVEKEATIKRIKEVYCAGCNSYNGVRCRACGTGDAIDMIEDAPAVDAEVVVRCKDCYQSVVIGNVLHCTYWGKNTDENGYCHEGG